MTSPWLLLPLLFILARAFSNPKHPGGHITEGAPSCDELRAFWAIFNRASRTSEETNEIPVLPLRIYDSIVADGGRKKHHPKSLMEISKTIFSNRLDAEELLGGRPWNTLQAEYVLPLRTKTPSDTEMNGIFGEFYDPSAAKVPSHHRLDFDDPQSVRMVVTSDQRGTEPEIFGFGSSSAMPLPSAKKNGESEFYLPHWGSPDEVDSFGSFVDYDFQRTPKDSVGEVSAASQGFVTQGLSKVVCDVILNTECNMSEQCACKGTKKLVCNHGKCLNEEKKKDIMGKYGTWHDGPVPQSQLRLLSMLRKRSNRSVFM